MRVEVQKSFEKDISGIRDSGLAARVYESIEELERATTLSAVQNLRKLHANGSYYRLKIGKYRLGFKLDKGVIILLRFMDRKDIYKYFP